VFFEKRPLDLNGTLESRFSFDHTIGQTADAIGYQGYDKETKKARVVWTTRSVLSEAQKKSFFKHVRGLIATRVGSVLDFGTDSAGVGFVILASSVSKRLGFDHGDAHQKATRLIKALLAVEKIHSAGGLCGNLTPDAFMLDAEEEVHFVGFIGGVRRHKSLPVGSDFQRYLSPEVSNGELPSQSCDVYAIAVIGLELFGVGFPEGPLILERMGEYLTGLEKDTPVWLQAVLPNVVSSGPEQKFQNASELLSAIAIQLKNQEELMKDEGVSDEDRARVHDDLVSVGSRPRSSRNSKRRTLALLQIPAVSIVLSLVILVLGGLYGYENDFFKQVVEEPQAPVKQLVIQSKDLKTRLAGIRELDTPEVFSMLEAEANATSNPGEKALIWGAMIEYGRINGMPRTARALQQLLDTPDPRLEPLMPEIVRLLNPARSPDTDRTIVAAVEQSNGESGALLSAALTLDMPDSSRFRDALLKAACPAFQRAPSARCEDISTRGLILAISSTRRLYFSDVLQSPGAVPNSDFWPLLQLMVAQRSEEQAAFARFGLERKVEAWPRSVFLDILSSATVSVSVPALALAGGAQGVFTDNTVTQFSEWYEPASVQALLGTIIASSDEGVRSLAMGALDDKPISDNPLRGLLSFIESRRPETRLRYANLVALVGLREQAPRDAFIEGLQSVGAAPDRNAICLALLQSGDARIINAVLDLYGSSLNPELLLVLLGHEDTNIRLATLSYVRGVILTSAKQTLQGYYANEKDPTVRAAYEREVPELLR
jgi:hypothetical protein